MIQSFRTRVHYGLTALVLFSLFQCQRPGAVFVHDIGQGPKPWSNESFVDHSNDFTFAIISDLYGGEREGVFDVAVEQLRLIQPTFILTVGDLIDGGTEDRQQLQREFDRFDQRADKAGPPVFHIGGNHDLTNPVMRQFWIDRYGRRYYHFLYRDVLFLMLDSEDFEETRMREIYLARDSAIQVLETSGYEEYKTTSYYKMEERRTGAISKQQSEYFIEVLQEYPNARWTFLLMHKPVWMREDDGGLKRIEEALGNRPYTVINGHFHDYSHRIRNDRDYIILGTTSGSQNPSSDMSFDHITLIGMRDGTPSMVNVRLEGILDKTGHVPLNGDTLCYQLSRCQ